MTNIVVFSIYFHVRILPLTGRSNRGKGRISIKTSSKQAGSTYTTKHFFELRFVMELSDVRESVIEMRAVESTV